jgi:hypothetical protein
MHMANGLPAVTAGIEDHAVPGAGDAAGDRHLMGESGHLGEQPVACRGEPCKVRVMVIRDNQDMYRCLRVQVGESDRPRAGGDPGSRHLAGRDAAEQAVGHGLILTCATPADRPTYMVALLRTLGAPPPRAHLLHQWLALRRSL